MNDAKSAPFAHIPYVENPCIPPKISKSLKYQKATISANHAKFAYHFSI